MSGTTLEQDIGFEVVGGRGSGGHHALAHAIRAGRGSTQLLFAITAGAAALIWLRLNLFEGGLAQHPVLTAAALVLVVLASAGGLLAQWAPARVAETSGVAAIGLIGLSVLLLSALWVGQSGSFSSYFLGLFLLGALALSSARPQRLLPVTSGLLVLDVTMAYWRTGWTQTAHLTLLCDSMAALIGGATSLRLQRLHQREWLRTRQALEDPLTGLSNRRAFQRDGEMALAQARRERVSVTLALIDVDRFKRINDEHGHAAGDLALQSVADSLRHAARRPLDCVVRLGGDEFAVLWFDLDQTQAQQRCEALVAGIAGKHLILPGGGEIPHPTISLGACSVPGGAASDLSDLQRRADAALYQAKEASGNQVRITRSGLTRLRANDALVRRSRLPG